jgi:methanogenic corrinoid protein MtbC1
VYHQVKLDRAGLAKEAFDRLRIDSPALFKEASAYQRTRAEEDLADHLGALEDSLSTGRPALFLEYIRRACLFFSFRHLPPHYVPDSLRALRPVLADHLTGDLRDNADAFLKKGIAAAREIPLPPPSRFDDRNPLSGTARAYLDALVRADRATAETILADATDSGVSVDDLSLCVIVPVLEETGRRWLVQETSVAEEHYISAAAAADLFRLHERALAEHPPVPRKKSVIVAAAEQDLHAIGMQMVAGFFERDGWDTYYIGPNTPVQSLIRAARDRKADVIALSCSMPAYLAELDYLIRSLRADLATAHAKIIVGGRPFATDPPLWRQIGADAYAKDAADAVTAVHRLVE